MNIVNIHCMYSITNLFKPIWVLSFWVLWSPYWNSCKILCNYRIVVIHKNSFWFLKIWNKDILLKYALFMYERVTLKMFGWDILMFCEKSLSMKRHLLFLSVFYREHKWWWQTKLKKDFFNVNKHDKNDFHFR